VAAAAWAGLPWARLIELLVVSNVTLGLCLAAAGWPVAVHRPGNAVGWLLLGGGVSYASTGAGIPLLAVVARAGAAGEPGWQLFAMLVNGGWSWALTLFLPLALLCFPDGGLPGRGWRWLVVVVAAAGPLAFAGGALSGFSEEVGVPGYVIAPGVGQRLIGIAFALLPAIYLAAVTSLILRYRRGDDRTRRQLLWVLLALLVVVVIFLLDPVLPDSLLSILPIALIPAAILVAIFRYGLLDIRLVFSRSLLYVLLTGAAVGAYLAVVAGLGRILTAAALLPSVAATLVVALAFHPVRVWLQRRVDHLVYGARQDPVRALSEVGARLADTDGLDDVLAALCRALRLPYAAIVVHGRTVARCGPFPGDPAAGASLLGVPASGAAAGGSLLDVPASGAAAGASLLGVPASGAAADASFLGVSASEAPAPGAPFRGVPAEGAAAVPLPHGAGELVVGLRSGERRLAAADQRMLALLAAPISVAVRATELAEELTRSREQTISAREEERRRLRRDLHDGLGPVLTGVVLNAEAARRLVRSDPDRSETLIGDLRDQTTAALEDIRRLVYGLRPPALDSLGLVGALQEYAMTLPQRSSLRVTVEAATPLDDLPAAAEVAAYRIVTEALTNVTRHSNASAATVVLSRDGGELRVAVHDDGVNAGTGWQPGVGLTSIRERAAELGGRCTIALDRTGGRIDVWLPVPVAAVVRS
jgi:two-component system NarL family sensor kinase